MDQEISFDGIAWDVKLPNGEHMYVGHIPERKKIALGVYCPGNSVKVLAYFADESAARFFLQMFPVRP